ncbi:hypothetical protein TrLO_g3108 [Triparma laevis f. longispina]|uniref:Uncharacterized protein n=1 Tax=Triparma laevis f. longispina TaxID=1714387 RepID=A0A9W7FJ83_9STRA|nr:hypothetical protein TrLO_g3108 [Triparma laevis f. longispina]
MPSPSSPAVAIFPFALFSAGAIASIIAAVSITTGPCFKDSDNSLNTSCPANAPQDLSTLYVTGPVNYLAAFFNGLAAFTALFVLAKTRGKGSSQCFSGFAIIFAFAGMIILCLNWSYWTDAMCSASKFSAPTLGEDYCALAHKASTCSVVSFVCALLGSVTWCNVTIRDEQKQKPVNPNQQLYSPLSAGNNFV